MTLESVYNTKGLHYRNPLFKHEQEALNQREHARALPRAKDLFFFFYLFLSFDVSFSPVHDRSRRLESPTRKGYDFKGFVSVLVHVTLVARVHGAHHVVRHSVGLLFGRLVGGHVQAFVNLQANIAHDISYRFFFPVFHLSDGTILPSIRAVVRRWRS